MKKGVIFTLVFVLLASAVVAETVELRPDGQGKHKQWRHVNCPKGAGEWQCVDEDPVDTSDYLRTGGANRKETFTFSDSGLTNEQINSVTLVYEARWQKSSKFLMSTMMRSGGVDFTGAEFTLTSSFQTYSDEFTTNPATGQAWTVAEVDALEAGMRTFETNRGGRVAQMFAIVDYTATTPDSCSDTDGGQDLSTFGTTSGIFQGNPFSNDDVCSGDFLQEFFCQGTQESFIFQSCGNDSVGASYCQNDDVFQDFTDNFCSAGACGSSTTPQLVEDCGVDQFQRFCSGDDVMQNTTDNFCSAGACGSNVTTTFVTSCAHGCSNGFCNPAPSCIDSDGFNPFTAGFVNVTTSSGSFVLNDFCVNNATLTERLCSGAQPNATNVSCSNGCSAGACN